MWKWAVTAYLQVTNPVCAWGVIWRSTRTLWRYLRLVGIRTCLFRNWRQVTIQWLSHLLLVLNSLPLNAGTKFFATRSIINQMLLWRFRYWSLYLVDRCCYWRSDVLNECYWRSDVLNEVVNHYETQLYIHRVTVSDMLRYVTCYGKWHVTVSDMLR
jgi:hypothetical protein